MARFFEILRTGTFKDTSGRDHTFTMKDLRDYESNFNEGNGGRKVPITIGHPKDNSPAWGWLDKLKVQGDRLLASASSLVPAFVDAVRARQYKEISSSLYPKNKTLRHVAFLGGAQPAVPGLESVCFSESEEETATFTENAPADFIEGKWLVWKIHRIGRILGAIRDYLIEKDGVDAADNIISRWEVDDLKEEPPEPPEQSAEPVQSYSEGEIENSPMETGKEDKVMKQETKGDTGMTVDLSERNTALETENLQLKQQLADRDNAERRREVSEFVEGLKTAGKILPKHVPAIINVLMDLKGEPRTIDLSEGKTEDGYAAMCGFLAELKPLVPTAEFAAGEAETSDNGFSEFSEGGVDQERLEIHNKALALQRKEKISYDEAVSRIIRIKK